MNADDMEAAVARALGVGTKLKDSYIMDAICREIHANWVDDEPMADNFRCVVRGMGSLMEKVRRACSVVLDVQASWTEKDDDDGPFGAHTAMYARALQAMQDRVHAIIRFRFALREPRVFYSAYTTEDDLPVDNLDGVAVPGRVIFMAHRNEFYGGPESREYMSPVYTNPTWLDIAVLADDAIQHTRDTHHIYLEGVEYVPGDGGQRHDNVHVYRFVMGS